MTTKAQEIQTRQNQILEYITQQGEVSVSGILQDFPAFSRITTIRDLDRLCESGQLRRIGKGRGVRYQVAPTRILHQVVEPEQYFAIPHDDREIQDRFNPQVFELLEPSVFTPQESEHLRSLHETFQANFSQISSPTIVKKEYERILIEFSWKSSQIEGNTYSLLDTERLIKENIPEKGKTKEETQMILNHKEAFNFILEHRSDFTTLSRSKIEHIHHLLTADLGVTKNIRTTPVGITGTNYRPLDNAFQIEEALEQMVKLINAKDNFFEKAFLSLVLLSYIQAFEDGNKRTARMTANALLLAFDSTPISYRAVDEVEYKKASLLFYEQNNLSYFKEIFIDQYAFAGKHYFQV